MVKINETTALAIGGPGSFGRFPKVTHFLSLMDMKWNSNGPKILEGRYYHACGLIESSGDSGERYQIKQQNVNLLLINQMSFHFQLCCDGWRR